MEISTILKILSDENRLRIMNILKEYSLCVGEIQSILNIRQSNASRHLEKLKNSGLITYQKKAQWIYYQLSSERLEEYPFIKQLIFEDIKGDLIFQEDLYKLNRYKASGLCCEDLRQIGFDFSKIKF
ncbi:MAG: ArsR/SmtB family transcription factor [Clostridiaceae bacterium]